MRAIFEFSAENVEAADWLAEGVGFEPPRPVYDGLRASAYEAHTLLAEIYGWFAEGFESADLKEAKALLDELSG